MREQSPMTTEPTLTPEHQKLHVFAGSWTGEEMLVGSRWLAAGPARSYITGTVGLDGFSVMQDYRQERDGKVSFRGHGVFGFDTEDRLYKLYWFDKLGYVPPAPASGPWKGDTLILRRASLRGAARHTYRFESHDRFTLKLEYSWSGDDDWVDVLTGTYTRQPGQS